MILVNSPGSWGGIYSQLEHAKWNGWTFTDCVFPNFLFIVGVSLLLALSRHLDQGESAAQIDRWIARRAVVIFLLGLFVNSYPIFHLSTLRIPGVLQRIALCTLFASLILLKFRVKGQAIWLAGLLAVYWAVMAFIPVPDVGTGVLEPGRNLAAYVDSLFLSGHMFTNTWTWDPEGIVSTLPAISTTLFGVMAGHWLKTDRTSRVKALGMLGAGIALLAAGEILNLWLPINKNIWTSSYAVFMAGISTTGLAILYWIVDVRGWRRWTKPFVIFGMNSITVYVLSETLDTTLSFIPVFKQSGSVVSLRDHIFHKIFEPHFSIINASLMFAVAYVVLMYLVAWFMWRKKWFPKV